MPPQHLRPRSLPELVDAAVQLLRGRYTALAALAGLVLLPYAVAEALYFAQFEEVQAADLLVWYGSMGLADAAIAVAVAGAYHGRDPGTGAALATAAARGWSVVPAALLKWALVGLGLTLILPGVFAYVAFFAVPAVAVLERLSPVAALRRSWALSAGARWSILFVVGGIALAHLGAGSLGEALAQALFPGREHAAERLLGTLGAVLLAPPSVALTTLLYYDRRIRREGYDVQVMAGE